jgi:hypothetical protein
VDAHIEFFVEAVLAHPDSQTLLMALFKDQVRQFGWLSSYAAVFVWIPV